MALRPPEERVGTVSKPVEPILWAGAMLAAVLVGLPLGALASLVIFPWSILVWPLHRRRSRESPDWPPAYGLELWQTALASAVLTLAAFAASRLTEQELLDLLFLPVAYLSVGVSAAAVALLTFYGASSSSGGEPQDGPELD
jgi:hypothetical protein